MGQVLEKCPADGQGVDAGVIIKPAVFIGQKRLKVEQRDLIWPCRIPPHPVCVGKGPQGHLVAVHNNAGYGTPHGIKGEQVVQCNKAQPACHQKKEQNSDNSKF